VLQAIRHAHCITDVIARSLGTAAHPNLMPAWEYVVSVHERAGDEAGVREARKSLLKCKSAGLRGRDSSHKPKQRKRRGK
jgi:hypothetical protein